MKIGCYTELIKINDAVQKLDPLGADHYLTTELPRLNVEKQVGQIVNLAQKLVPKKEVVTKFSPPEAMAATRDLGIIASSLRRHDMDFAIVPSLEATLIELSHLTDEVPADSVTSYGPRNPVGQRIRTFTPYPQECLFIESFREGLVELNRTVEQLELAQNLSIHDPNFGTHIRIAETHFQSMVAAVVAVRK